MEIVLQDYCEAAADDRRHGDAHLSVAISIPELKIKVIKKYLESRLTTPAPPNECIYTVLPHAQSTMKFTIRFNI